MTTQRPIMLLGGTAIAALILGLWLSQGQQPKREALAQDAPLFPELATRLNDVDGVKLTTGGDRLLVELKRDGDRWVVANKGNYPAALDNVRKLLIGLGEAKIRQTMTANPANYGKLGVEDVTEATAKGVRVELSGLGSPLALIVGQSAEAGNATYVRLADQAQSLLVSGSLRPDSTLSSWLEAAIVNLPGSRIQSVGITPPKGTVLTVSKNDPADPNWVVQNVPKGRQLTSEAAGNVLTSVLDNLNLEDVHPAGEKEPDPAGTWRAVYRTFEGIDVTLQGWEAEGKAYARLSAALDPARNEAYLAAEQQREEARRAAAAAEQKAGAEAKPESGAEVQQAATPEPLDAEKFRAEKLAALNKEVEEINRRVSGWTYVIPSWKFANVKKTMEDMLQPVGSK